MANAKYKEWLSEDSLLRIESWASNGLTNEDIAQNMGVTAKTLRDWRSKYSAISAAIKKGREPVVRVLENALIRKAKGFEYEEQTVTIKMDSKGNKVPHVVKHKRYSLPDTGALIFLLKNYEPNKYRNYNDLTKKQIEQEIKKMEAEIQKLEAELSNSDKAETALDKYLGQLEERIDGLE